MSRIDNLDKVLEYVCLFSKDLAFISEVDLANNTQIEIDELVEYLEELGNRGYITNSNNGSYITDFFVDMNIAFAPDSVTELATLIRIYATQKKLDPTMNKVKFVNLIRDVRSVEAAKLAAKKVND